MEYITRVNLRYINHKYHDPFKRYLYHGYDYDPDTGRDGGQMRAELERLHAQIKEEFHPICPVSVWTIIGPIRRVKALTGCCCRFMKRICNMERQ